MKKNTSVSDAFYEDFKKEIIELHYFPGTIITTQELSNKYGISRTPVKEVLVRLKEEGLLTETTGNKFSVPEITLKYIKDLYEMRIIFESAAIRSFRDDISGEFIAKLRNETARIEEALHDQDYDKMFLADENFHQTILSLYDNDILHNIYKTLRGRQIQIRFLTIGIQKRLIDTIPEHNAIIDCLEHNDIEGAVKNIEIHFHNTLEDMFWLKENNPMFNNYVK